VSGGIHRIAIPTPFAVGRVNVYLIEDKPLTLVDAGPNSGTSFDELTSGLAALGDAPQRHPRGRGQRAQLRLTGLPRLGRAR
jgi:hypothetical protein